jgi:hypothetical protein
MQPHLQTTIGWYSQVQLLYQGISQIYGVMLSSSISVVVVVHPLFSRFEKKSSSSSLLGVHERGEKLLEREKVVKPLECNLLDLKRNIKLHKNVVLSSSYKKLFPLPCCTASQAQLATSAKSQS